MSALSKPEVWAVSRCRPTLSRLYLFSNCSDATHIACQTPELPTRCKAAGPHLLVDCRTEAQRRKPSARAAREDTANDTRKLTSHHLSLCTRLDVVPWLCRSGSRSAWLAHRWAKPGSCEAGSPGLPWRFQTTSGPRARRARYQVHPPAAGSDVSVRAGCGSSACRRDLRTDGNANDCKDWQDLWRVPGLLESCSMEAERCRCG